MKRSRLTALQWYYNGIVEREIGAGTGFAPGSGNPNRAVRQTADDGDNTRRREREQRL